MLRRIVFASILSLLAAVLVLSVRLYQTTRQLDKAEQYMMSGVAHWTGICGAIATDLGGPEPWRVRTAASLVQNYCLSSDDRPRFEALLHTGELRDAVDFTLTRVYEPHLPRILKLGSYDRSSFPVGYR